MRLSNVIDYPFPLSDGSILWLRVPTLGLSHEDAVRLGEYVMTLVPGDPPLPNPDPED